MQVRVKRCPAVGVVVEDVIVTVFSISACLFREKCRVRSTAFTALYNYAWLGTNIQWNPFLKK